MPRSAKPQRPRRHYLTAFATIIALAALPSCDEASSYASISSPSAGTSVVVGDSVWFQGEVNSDRALGINLDGDWRWTSDLDGVLGTTATFALTNLSIGEHLITLRVVNAEGVVLRDQVRIVVRDAR